MRLRLLTAFMAALLLAAAMPRLAAQTVRPAKSAPLLMLSEALPLTCEQAWVAAGRSYGPMLDTVKTLAKLSLANRNLTLPNTRQAGLDAGRGIAEDCKTDPQALLFAVVDRQVRRVAESAGR